MTSSATSSKPRRPPPVQPGLLVALVGGGLLLVGWAVILHANRWHLTAPVIFLMLGWAAVLATAWFLGKAALAATGPDPGSEESWSPAGQYEELVAEKKALLRALKDIEFDHQMGKMSDEDAGQLQRYYRARAIEVLKAIDTIEHGAGGTPAERIEREVRARLAVDAKGRKVGGGEGVKGEAKAPPAAEPAADEEPAAAAAEPAADEEPAAAAAAPPEGDKDA